MRGVNNGMYAVIGNDVTITMAGASGNFELNVYRPVIAHNILESIKLLSDSSNSFAANTVDGITQILKRLIRIFIIL